MSTRIVIVGAGPAGAVAAMELAAKGHRATVIDASSFPRDKICGDALSLDVLNQLNILDPSLARSLKASPASIASGGVRISAPSGKCIDIPFIHKGQPNRGYVMPRFHFDQLLFDRMRGMPGLDIRQDFKLSRIERSLDAFVLHSDQDSLEADLILGADGAQSVVARQLGHQKVLHDHHSAGLRQYYSNVSGFREHGYIELHFLPEILPGYLWVFPLPDGRANVGIGMLSSALKRRKINLRQTMEHALRNHPLFCERFRDAVAEEEPRGFGLPLGSIRRTISGEGYLLLGDAAGLIDPFSGEGIANAIRSGRVAASYIDRQLASGKGFDAKQNLAYDEEIWSRVWQELKLSRKLQRLCAYPALFNRVVAEAQRNPSLREFLINALSEVSVKRQITRPTFWWKLITRS